jgi:DNA-binding NarL/FixJ family response regulator
VRVVTQTNPQVRLLIVDDSPRVRRGVSDLFAGVEDIDVVGVAANGLDALASVRRLVPDVVLMDLSMPVMDGIEATRRIKALDPTVSVVILTALHQPQREALEAGASGRVLKEAPPEELVRQVRFAAY